MLYNIKQRNVMEEQNHPISWDYIKKVTTKLANNKAQGLNGVLPNSFNALGDVNLSWLLIFYNQFCHSQDDFDEWHGGQVFNVPKKVTPPTPTNGEGSP